VEPYPSPALDRVGREDFATSLTLLDDMVETLSGEAMMSCSQAVLEEYVTETGRELQRQLMQDQLDARARLEERRREITGSDGVTRRRAQRGHRRLVATTVGRVEAERIAYRALRAPNLHPADAVLELPTWLYSHPLRKLIAHEVARSPARAAGEAVARATGQRLGTRQLLATAQHAARDIRDFYRLADLPPTGAGGGDLLVLSVDATGVAMIESALREATKQAARTAAEQAAGTAAGQAPSAQLSRRDRAGRTRMATVAAVYDATPAERSAADILPTDRAEREARRPGPTARGRQLDASVVHSTAAMVTAMFDSAQRRDPEHRRRWIVLVDGANHQLDCIQREAARRGVKVNIIVDFVHVLEYVWRAADELHPARAERAAWVAASARTILEGGSARIVSDIRAAVRRIQEGDTPTSVEAATRAAAYIEAKEPYLVYHLALALGWPIASGVIEGSCRNLVKDRLDVTGARWDLPSAEAVLLLRAVINNGDFESYWAYHLQREYLRDHAVRYTDQLTLAA
jgi:hypothetical protein